MHLPIAIQVALINGVIAACVSSGGIFLWIRQRRSAKTAQQARADASEVKQQQNNNQFSEELIRSAQADAQAARTLAESTRDRIDAIERDHRTEREKWFKQLETLNIERRSILELHSKERKQWVVKTDAMQKQLDECTKEHGRITNERSATA